MFGELIIMNILNLIIISVCMFLSGSWQRTSALALVYAVSIALVALLFAPNIKPFIFLGGIGNLVISYGIFIARRRYDGWLRFIISFLGGLLLLYIAFLPIGYALSQFTRSILQ